MNSHNNISPIGPGGGNPRKLSEDKLLAYLEGKLSPAEQHEVEQWLADEGMENDAMEGLQELPAAERAHSINRINHKLRKSLTHKKQDKRKLKTDYNMMAAVFIILLLAAVAYAVIHYSR